MREGLRDLLADMVGRILSGSPADAVYAAWRARTGPLVAQARDRHQAPPASYPPVSGPVARRSAAAFSPGPATDVAWVGGRRLRARLPEVVDATIDGSGGPLRIWVVAREAGPAPPTLPVTYLDLGHLPPAADLLLLPDLLPEVDRLVVLGPDDGPVDAARLARLDLQGAAVGARISDQPAAGVWRRAADRLPPEDAAELRRLMSARHPFSVRAIENGPLVLDLAQMRADESRTGCLAQAAHFGLDGRAALLAYAGSHLVPLTHDGQPSA
jgi:hypothetical protein